MTSAASDGPSDPREVGHHAHRRHRLGELGVGNDLADDRAHRRLR